MARQTPRHGILYEKTFILRKKTNLYVTRKKIKLLKKFRRSLYQKLKIDGQKDKKIVINFFFGSRKDFLGRLKKENSCTDIAEEC